MNQQRFAGNRFVGNRKQFRGKAKGYWSELSIEPLQAAGGTRDPFADRILEPYGISNEEAARQLDGFLGRNRDWDLSHG